MPRVRATGHRGQARFEESSPPSGAADSAGSINRSGRRAVKASQRSPRREQIIDRAVALMQEKGYLGTSIQDVADELDFTKAAFYYFVKNKEELLYTALSDFDQLLKDWKEKGGDKIRGEYEQAYATTKII